MCVVKLNAKKYKLNNKKKGVGGWGLSVEGGTTIYKHYNYHDQTTHTLNRLISEILTYTPPILFLLIRIFTFVILDIDFCRDLI